MAKNDGGGGDASSSSSARRPWESYHTVYTNAKAGMEGVDKEKVQKIVYEMSKGSKYFENEERKEAYMKQKIENMRAQRAKLTTADISHYQKVADKRIMELEATRDLSKIWLHVDMDAFYAAVETLHSRSLEGKPMAVGSMSMISTANYEARKFGVRAAMPGFIACKLCPQLIFVPIDFKKYTHYSDLTRKVFQNYDPNFMAASLDEAYLDITKVCRERDISGGEVAEELRRSVYEATGLTCSAGVAPNRLLAKVCSDINKPNGQFILPNDRMAVMTFISSLPIRKIGGIGKVTENILKDVFEIKTCEDMLQKSYFLCALFSRSSADFFLSVGLGLGGTDTPQVRMRKSISSERTFSATADEAFLYQKLGEIADMLSADMEKEGLCGRTLTLKLKTASFEVQTRAVTLQSSIWTSEDILKHASSLLKAELPISLRLMGCPPKVSPSGIRAWSIDYAEDHGFARSLEEDKQQSKKDKDWGKSKPKTDCLLCGGWHWMRDCPKRQDLRAMIQSWDQRGGDFGMQLNGGILAPSEGETRKTALVWDLGLRMSHFDDDNDSILSDPTQKTISDFFTTGDDFRKNVDSRLFLNSDAKDSPEIQRNEFGNSSADQIPDLDSYKCSSSSLCREIVEGHRLELEEFKDKADPLFLTGQVEDTNLNQEKRIHFSDDEAGSLSSQKESLIWLDDYKCSLCGVELPSSFVEERQEHADFHLAERLQEEESGNSHTNAMPKRRSIEKDTIANKSRGKKKQKQSPSDGKHLPIDMFFVKRTPDT